MVGSRLLSWVSTSLVISMLESRTTVCALRMTREKPLFVATFFTTSFKIFSTSNIDAFCSADEVNSQPDPRKMYSSGISKNEKL